jgi:FAD:protein FMN transferase
MTRSLWRFVVAGLSAFCAGCLSGGAAGVPRLVEQARVSMGSELRLTAWTGNEERTAAAFEEVFREFDRLDALMSVWRDGSDVQRINRAAGQHPVATSGEVREVLRHASQISEWTGGKFDITFGALSDLWKFDHDQDDRIPRADAVRRRLLLIDYTAIDVDERAGSVFLKQHGMRIHLGGIGKGFAIERAADLLRRRGLSDFMIQAGGDLYAAGRHGDREWRTAIQDPRGVPNRAFAAIDLSDRALSTSGDYERFFIHSGRRYHHILDPDVGEPARGCRSVSVIADRSAMADGLSTGVFILGPAAGMALIERLPNVEGVIVTERNEVLVSSGLKDRLISLAQPTDSP